MSETDCIASMLNGLPTPTTADPNQIPDWVHEPKTEDLDRFVAFIDAIGGPSAPQFATLHETFRYRPNAQVDESLDPCSEDYTLQMIAVYEEIAGRPLDQESGELTPIDVENYISTPNPLGSINPNTVSAHAVAILNAIMAANLPLSPRVLDLGCGWGQTTELLNYCAASVTAIDISPDFVEIVRRRAERTMRDVQVMQATFDDFEVEGPFDMALFYECLHHSVRPWSVLKKVADVVSPDGLIVLAGEPINDLWWRHWGMRLDPISVYCCRKFGWFESGWSEPFLRRMFDDLGWDLTLVPWIGLNSGITGFARRADSPNGSPLTIPSYVTHLTDLQVSQAQSAQELTQLRAENAQLKAQIDSSAKWRGFWQRVLPTDRRG